ncbi:hypothetical protein [Streptacidiphilus monticola]|uniref:Uncharacterized protein n=1 Tax=Streptacidiphilus monticola TaxID=2161674 RepID=A0ABW1G2I3_9ACTN
MSYPQPPGDEPPPTGVTYTRPPEQQAALDAQNRKNRSKGCGCLALVATVIGIGIAAAAGGGDKTENTASNQANPNVGISTTKVITTSPNPKPTAPKPTPTKADPNLALKRAITSWWNGGGSDKASAIETDFNSITTDSGNQDVNGLDNDCSSLSADVTAAQEYRPIPDKAAQSHWRKALNLYASAASDCLIGIAGNDASLIVKSSREIGAGVAQLNQTTARITEIAAL